MRESPEIYVVGRATVDLYANEPGRPLAEAETFTKYVGGCPANIAFGLARLGRRVGFLGRVGAEELGRFVRAAMEAEGIDTAGLAEDPEHNTGLNLLALAEGFPLLFYRRPCADEFHAPEDLEGIDVAAAGMVVASCAALSSPLSARATLRAVRRARAKRRLVAVDVDHRPAFWERAPAAAAARTPGAQHDREEALEAALDQMRGLARTADILIGTVTEISLLAGSRGTPEALAEAALRLGPGEVVIKRGEAGCLVAAGGAATPVPGFPAAPVNPLGAGDAFAAGYLARRFEGAPPAEAARFGNACGAIVVGRHACSAAMPRRAEVEDFLRARG